MSDDVSEGAVASEEGRGGEREARVLHAAVRERGWQYQNVVADVGMSAHSTHTAQHA